MLKIILFASFIFFALVSCEYRSNKQRTKVEKIDKRRCSFELSNNLYLGKIDSSFDNEGYIRVLSDESENRMQLFVYNSSIDIDEELKIKIEALNSPDIFTANSIDSVNQFGKYKGKGVIMKGTYEGGIVKGRIKVFCHGREDKGFIVVLQMTLQLFML
jgi:hypothetical protein